LLVGLQEFPTSKQFVSLDIIGLKCIISDYNQGHIIWELRTRGESASHLNEYYMVRVMAIPYLGYGYIYHFLSLVRTIHTLPHLLISPTPIARIPQNIIFIIGKEGSMGFMQTLVLHI
jgi:hypothetical protein